MFEGKNHNLTQTLILVNHATDEFLASSAIPNPSNSSAGGGFKSSTRWRPPRDNMLKINTYASFNPVSGAGSSGIVIRDNKGKMITGTTFQIYATSAFIAEALALREGSILAHQIHSSGI